METHVYLIRCITSGSAYVGITCRPKIRWKEHRGAAKGTKQGAFRVHRSIAKHGVDAHRFDVVETFPTRSEASEAEQWWIAYLRSLGAYVLNLTTGGEGGARLSSETCAKMSASRMGHPTSEETRRKISEAQKGRKLPAHQVEAMKNRTFSAETRAKMSAAKKTPEIAARLRALNQREYTPEYRKKLSDAHGPEVFTPELRRRMSEAQKNRIAAQQAIRDTELRAASAPALAFLARMLEDDEE